MRVAYLINQYPKVSHSFIRREILALERQGIEIIRISLRGWDCPIVDDEDYAERKLTRYVLRESALALLLATGLAIAVQPLRFLQALKASWRMSRRAERSLPIHLMYLIEACCVLRWLRRDRVDHLHAHFGTNSAEVAMLSNILGGPKWSFTVHGPEEFDKAGSIGLPEKIRQAEFVVAVSSFGRSQLYRLVEQDFWPKLQVVHCGLDDKFRVEAQPFPTSRRLVCVGRLCEQKGQLLLIQAMRRLIDSGVNCELILAGDGELRGQIEKLVRDLHLQDSVQITGWISSTQVRKEILRARALVLPSFAEGLPVVLMEAMALQRPVISTYVAGIPELVVPKENGWLVPAGDIDELVKAIDECLSMPIEDIIAIGARAHLRCVDRHDVNKEAKKLVWLFKGSSSKSDRL